MIITSASLAALQTGFRTSFQAGWDGAPSQWSTIAMEVPSATAEEKYPWMKDIPGIREWVGERIIHNLEGADYAIKNKDWELSIGVNRNDIEDDRIGLYAPLFTEIGRQARQHPDRLVFPLLKAGFSTPCYDGQYFFDTDHPVEQPDGSVAAVSNMQAGAGAPWFLLDLSRAIKPVVYQNRRPMTFVRMDAATDEAVFSRKEYRYGVDGRSNVGFSFWQLAYGSKAALTHDNYAAARAAMQSLCRRDGTPLGIAPTHLVVPPALEAAARQILRNQTKAGGEANEWQGTAQLIHTPWLA